MKTDYYPSVVVLSFGIAYLGSYLAITVCEQYRQCRLRTVESRLPSNAFHGIMSVCLGGVGIWCMHFVGMSAVSMQDLNGDNVEVRYDIGMTILSLALVLIFATVGFWLSAKDGMFIKTKREIFELIVIDASAMTMRDAKHISPTQLLWIIGTHSPQYLFYGGFCAGSGVIVMHYVGMAAMKFPGKIVWNVGIIAASCCIAFTAATAAFWILFRFLSTYTNREDLRLACAFTMAIAVCGMHYTGMAAARFEFDATVAVNYHSTMSSDHAFKAGIAVAAIVSFLAAVVALADLRYTVSKLGYELGRADETIMSLPAGTNTACLNHIQRYINKRKSSQCSLGILNQTAIFEADGDDGSVGNSVYSTGHSRQINVRPALSSPQTSIHLAGGGNRRRVHADCGVDVAERGEQSFGADNTDSFDENLNKRQSLAPTSSTATIATAAASNRNTVLGEGSLDGSADHA